MKEPNNSARQFLIYITGQAQEALSSSADTPVASVTGTTLSPPFSKSDEFTARIAPNFDTLALKRLQCQSCEEGQVICTFPVSKEVTNSYNTLHGGCIATLVDTVGTAALITVSDRSGVSVNIAVTYLLPSPSGQNVTVEARVIKSGRALATIQVDIKLQDGRVAATGLHTKYLEVGEPWQLKQILQERNLLLSRPSQNQGVTTITSTATSTAVISVISHVPQSVNQAPQQMPDAALGHQAPMSDAALGRQAPMPDAALGRQAPKPILPDPSFPPLDHATKFLNYLLTQRSQSTNSPNNFDTLTLGCLCVKSSSAGKLICTFPVTQDVTNRYQTLHGGCIATLVDVVSSAALFTVSDRTGVSVNLATTYLLPTALGTTVIVEATVLRVGRSLATIQVEVRLPDGRLAALGMHTKFLGAGQNAWRQAQTDLQQNRNSSLNKDFCPTLLVDSTIHGLLAKHCGKRDTGLHTPASAVRPMGRRRTSGSDDPYENQENVSIEQTQVVHSEKGPKQQDVSISTPAPSTCTLKSVTPSRLSMLQEELSCSICLEVVCRPCTTPCGHNFCRACLRRSLRHNPRCPKCRESLPPRFKPAVNTSLWNTTLLLFPAARSAPESPPISPSLLPSDQVQQSLQPQRQRQGTSMFPSNRLRITVGSSTARMVSGLRRPGPHLGNLHPGASRPNHQASSSRLDTLLHRISQAGQQLQVPAPPDPSGHNDSAHQQHASSHNTRPRISQGNFYGTASAPTVQDLLSSHQPTTSSNLEASAVQVSTETSAPHEVPANVETVDIVASSLSQLGIDSTRAVTSPHVEAVNYSMTEEVSVYPQQQLLTTDSTPELNSLPAPTYPPANTYGAHGSVPGIPSVIQSAELPPQVITFPVSGFGDRQPYAVSFTAHAGGPSHQSLEVHAVSLLTHQANSVEPDLGRAVPISAPGSEWEDILSLNPFIRSLRPITTRPRPGEETDRHRLGSAGTTSLTGRGRVARVSRSEVETAVYKSVEAVHPKRIPHAAQHDMQMPSYPSTCGVQGASTRYYDQAGTSQQYEVLSDPPRNTVMALTELSPHLEQNAQTSVRLPSLPTQAAGPSMSAMFSGSSVLQVGHHDLIGGVTALSSVQSSDSHAAGSERDLQHHVAVSEHYLHHNHLSDTMQDQQDLHHDSSAHNAQTLVLEHSDLSDQHVMVGGGSSQVLTVSEGRRRQTMSPHHSYAVRMATSTEMHRHAASSSHNSQHRVPNHQALLSLHLSSVGSVWGDEGGQDAWDSDRENEDLNLLLHFPQADYPNGPIMTSGTPPAHFHQAELTSVQGHQATIPDSAAGVKPCRSLSTQHYQQVSAGTSVGEQQEPALNSYTGRRLHGGSPAVVHASCTSGLHHTSSLDQGIQGRNEDMVPDFEAGFGSPAILSHQQRCKGRQQHASGGLWAPQVSEEDDLRSSYGELLCTPPPTTQSDEQYSLTSTATDARVTPKSCSSFLQSNRAQLQRPIFNNLGPGGAMEPQHEWPGGTSEDPIQLLSDDD
ncbi:hypothetical protein CEUSTIGMA_g6926.t1 [Chlamydomonas eustigma]|uniref:Acyl-coenzyme A thioesterase 13 n=1 Tax=Chlamydomonas eustigma TaxID=1157962 RepID=A0A250X8T6_9CHLO|nr:hypothetical protein CEUSTIGMA_g6926.t1 [Chlamydomonas eustigma]|eukprot:GAX79485.1 hypothetical protein CEUSTIGMA_g6926.t1 [Chlamydomonas eustigma]